MLAEAASIGYVPWAIEEGRAVVLEVVDVIHIAHHLSKPGFIRADHAHVHTPG